MPPERGALKRMASVTGNALLAADLYKSIQAALARDFVRHPGG